MVMQFLMHNFCVEILTPETVLYCSFSTNQLKGAAEYKVVHWARPNSLAYWKLELGHRAFPYWLHNFQWAREMGLAW